MKALLKFSALLIILILFIWIVSIRFIDSLTWQLMFLFILLAASVIRFDFAKFKAELKLIMPFLLTMFVVYLLIGLIGMKLKFWLTYGLLRGLNFLNTMLFIQLLLSYISINDIIALPVKIEVKKHFILGRALFCFALLHLGNLELHLKLMPEYQKPKLSLKQWFNLKLQQSFAIINMLLRESKLKGELIDNRIRHCFIINGGTKT